MIKFTKVPGPAGAPTLVMIPGGAGLSSLTLRSLDMLSHSFSLLYVDLPGCNGAPYSGPQSFRELMEEMRLAISTIPGDVILLGHSFGGFFAAAIALSGAGRGLICLSTPFSKASIESTVERYEAQKTDALKQAEDAWEKQPSDRTFADWVAEYRELYFHPDNLEQGRTLLLRDPVCHQQFVHLEAKARQMELLLEPLLNWSGKKLFLAETMGMISTSALQSDAERGGFEFHPIQRASHFLMFDQPEAVARRIEAMFATTKKGEV